MTNATPKLGSDDARETWLNDADHRAFLHNEAQRQFDFFTASHNPAGGFFVLGYDGRPLGSDVQELHTTTRLVHSYALGKCRGFADCDRMIDHGMDYLWSTHRDATHGGYLWAMTGSGKDAQVADARKLAYGHVFVLLAGASALRAGHPDALRLIDDVWAVLDEHFWDEDAGLFRDEFNRDWTPFSTYRGMNANMHAVEALLTAYEATGRDVFRARAGRILDFFTGQMAPQNDWRLPEHYTETWAVDRDYAGNPMFRPAGTTPGHSFELARLLVQHWELSGRPETNAVARARKLTYRALDDAWDKTRGGIVYTLKFDGSPDVTSRYWWPVTEAIGVLAVFLKLDPTVADEQWYRRLWTFASDVFIDHEFGGWFPEIDDANAPAMTQFTGKPDLYHALQAALFPLD